MSITIGKPEDKVLSSDFVSGLIAEHVREKMISSVQDKLRASLDEEIGKVIPEIRQIVEDFVGKVVVEKVYGTHDGMPVINVLVKGVNN